MRVTRLTAKMIVVLVMVNLVVPGFVSAQDQKISEVIVAGNENISKEAVLTAMALNLKRMVRLLTGVKFRGGRDRFGRGLAMP